MVKTVKGIKINRDKLTNNTQKAALVLLSREGWVSGKEIGRRIPSAAARIRDLRKQEFGAFYVECEQAKQLGKRGDSFYYRIADVKPEQVKKVFRV